MPDTLGFMRWVSGGAAAVVGAFWATAALSGCSGEAGAIVTETPVPMPSDSAESTPTPSASPSTTPSPASSAEELPPLTDEDLDGLLPEGARSETVDGAIATALFFVEQYAPMYHSGDTRLWEALSTDECGYCAGAIENAKAVHAEGNSVRGGEVTPEPDSVRLHVESAESVWVAFDAVAAEATTVRPDGDSRGTAEAASSEVAAQMKRVEGVWRVNALIPDGDQ